MSDDVEIEFIDEPEPLPEQVIETLPVDEPEDEKPVRRIVLGGGHGLISAAAALAAQPDVYARPTPDLLVPPTIKPMFDTEAPDGYEVDYGDGQGKEIYQDTSGPDMNQPVPEMDETRKARMNEAAERMLARLKAHNNRSAELLRRKEARTKKRRKKNKLAKATRKANRR